MTQEDQVFITNVVVINPTWKMVVSSVITRPVSAIGELNTIAKICKYKRFHEGHHFVLMAMEVHDTPKCDMDYFIKECARLFHDR
jgi:antirestriction protein